MSGFGGTVLAALDAFDRDVRDAGRSFGSLRLALSVPARTLRLRGGKPLGTDGPFAATKKQLGSICLIEAGGLEAAATTAARRPTADFTTAEVWPQLGIYLPAGAAVHGDG